MQVSRTFTLTRRNRAFRSRVFSRCSGKAPGGWKLWKGSPSTPEVNHRPSQSSAGARRHPVWAQAARTPQPRTHPQIVLSSAAASRLQPRSRATAASSRPESATPPSPGSADAGSSFSDKSPCPRSRPRHSSPKAPTWKTRVFRSGSSYSGKLQPPLLGIVSCLPPTPLHVGTPRLPSAMFVLLPSLQKPNDQGLAGRAGTCSCTWPTLASSRTAQAGIQTLHFPSGRRSGPPLGAAPQTSALRAKRIVLLLGRCCEQLRLFIQRSM